MPKTKTPLRYPGGKTRLSPYVSELIVMNDLLDCHYVEPYVGGAGLAIELLASGYIRYLHLNDIDRSIYALWYSVLNETDRVCKYIHDVNVNMNEWTKQKKVQRDKQNADLLSLGISTLFLNRTNRSGILTGGVIGGQMQQGKYKIDARFFRKTLIKRIELIAFFKKRICIFNKNALDFIEENVRKLPAKSIVNLDPPYYKKGQALYQNSYTHADHEEISRIIPSLNQHWIITYDNVDPIKGFYSDYKVLEFTLSYTAQKRYKGKEILIADPRLKLPPIKILKAI